MGLSIRNLTREIAYVDAVDEMLAASETCDLIVGVYKATGDVSAWAIQKRALSAVFGRYVSAIAACDVLRDRDLDWPATFRAPVA